MYAFFSRPIEVTLKSILFSVYMFEYILSQRVLCMNAHYYSKIQISRAFDVLPQFKKFWNNIIR